MKISSRWAAFYSHKRIILGRFSFDMGVCGVKRHRLQKNVKPLSSGYTQTRYILKYYLFLVTDHAIFVI